MEPNKLNEYPPVFVWPARPIAFAKGLFGHPGSILPGNLLYGLLGLALWLYATPSMATMQHFAPGWIAFLLARNANLVLVFWSGLAMHSIEHLLYFRSD